MNPDLHRPVNDNATHGKKHEEPMHNGKEKKGKKMDLPEEHKPSKSPQATSMPGALSIIENVSSGRGGNIHGIPGIINSTTTSPETRQRLVGGIIESLMGHQVAPAGPVQAVMGHDATAYNSGMVHLRGSGFTMHHK